MPTKASQTTPRTYKIRITPDRVLGPLDMDRVKQLVAKGRILGDEPTAIPPFASWSPFASYPELSELLLKKLETDSQKARPEEDAPAALPPTKTIVNPEVTKTLAQASENTPSSLEEDYGMPTLLDIRVTEKKEEENPDLEKTMVHLPALADSRELDDGSTKILDRKNIEQALAPYSPPETNVSTLTSPALPEKRGFFGLGKPVNPEDYVDETGKKRLLSRNTAALLALAILLMALWQQQDEEAADPANLYPKRFTFDYIEVNIPPRLGVDADPALSADLREKGLQTIFAETPGAYMKAIKKYFYPAIGRNPKNTDAKALLASSYIRISEAIPRDKRLFETLMKLLFPGPPKNQWTPDYVVALAEYYQLLNRHDQAELILDEFLRVRPTAELLYQRAKVAHERRQLDNALNFIAKAIPPEKLQPANPRHLLLYASLLEKRGQKDAALQNLVRLKRESIGYGPGTLYYADFLLRNGKPKESLKVLQFLINRPDLLEGMQRAEAFAVAARTFETLGMLPQALRFANAAYRDHFNKEEMEDLLFRVKSKIPSFRDTYSIIVEGRKNEKNKVLERALSLYIKAIEKNRNDPMPFMLIGRLYEERGEVYEAIDRYNKALFDTSEKPIDAAVNLARIYLKRFDMEKANNMIKRAEQMAISPPFRHRLDQVLYLKGIREQNLKKGDLAETFFDKALARNSRFIDLYVDLGDMEVERKNEKLAEFYYATALRYSPFHPKAMLGVALTRFHLDSPTGAVSFLKDKLSVQPNSAPIMTNLAMIYLKSGDPVSGKTQLQNAIRSDNKYADAFRLLGDLTKEEGDKQSDYTAKRHSYRYALASYEMYSKLAPNDPEGYKSTADLYFDIRDLGAAAKNYHKVLELTPNYPDVRLRLAQISRNGGDNDRAMDLLRQEIKVNPKSDAAWVEVGNIHMSKNDYVPATNAYTQAAHINEKNANALFGLGVVHRLKGSYDNALTLFERVLTLDRLKVEVYWQQGLALKAMNNKAKAIQAFTNYKGLTQDSAEKAKAEAMIRDLTVNK